MRWCLLKRWVGRLVLRLVLPDYSSSVSETGKDIENTSDLKGNESIATHSTRETGDVCCQSVIWCL